LELQAIGFYGALGGTPNDEWTVWRLDPSASGGSMAATPADRSGSTEDVG
jgi:hypothetical protein